MGSGMISIKGLDKVYHSGNQTIHALKDIYLDIEPGEIFGILGRQGAGKTTLARCLNLLERPSNGSITLGKCNLTSLREEDLRTARQKIGFFTKHTEQLLTSRTVYENIALPLEFKKSTKADIYATTSHLLQTMGLADKANLYPNHLNNGIKQKVTLARILAHQPSLLICDDPGNQLDLKTNLSLIQLLRELNEEHKLTIIYLTQDMENLKALCHRAAVLNQGEIVEQGTMVQLYANPTSNITKEFIKSTTRLELPVALRRRLKTTPAENLNPVLRISFLGPSAHEHLIAQVIQQFGLTLHIIQAHLENIHSQTMGIMIVEMNGMKENLNQAIQFLETKGLYIEVLGHVARTS